jgi:hypothetical protein
VESKVLEREDAHAGKCVYLMKGNPTLTQDLSLTPKKDYVVSLWVKVLENGGEVLVQYLDVGQKEGQPVAKVDAAAQRDWAQTTLSFHVGQPRGTLYITCKGAHALLDGIAVNSVDDQAEVARAPFAHVAADALPKPVARERVLVGPNADASAKVVEGWDTVTECPGGLPGFDGSSPLLIVAESPLGKTLKTTVTLTYTATAPVNVTVNARIPQNIFVGGNIKLEAGKTKSFTYKVTGTKRETDFDALRLTFNSPPTGTFWLHRVTVKE